MRCFGFGNDDCCNFYDRDDSRCLNECPEDTQPNDNFICEGVQHIGCMHIIMHRPEPLCNKPTSVELNYGITITRKL